MSASRQILVLFAHPNPSQSRVQKALYEAIRDLPGVEIRDLYQLYPQFYIDVSAEQEALVRADLVIFQHPIYWYSCPSLLKEWQDLVLERGFAYGVEGAALRGKDFLQVVSSGGHEDVYHRQGANRFTLHELLRPFEATAWLCGLNYHEPLTVQGINRLSEQDLRQSAEDYRQLLLAYQNQGRAVLEALNTAHGSFVHD